MKIAIVSPNKVNLDTMDRILGARTHMVSLHEGGKARMRAVADTEKPDLIIVEGMCCDPTELIQVDQLTTQHPAIGIVLLCPTHTPDFLINSMRAGVREVLPSPPSEQALIAAVDRFDAKLRGGLTRAQGKILAFIPCKGGSGATFLATNLGFHLAESKRVLLIDLNVQFGDALSFVYEGKPALTLANLAQDLGRLDASFLAANTVSLGHNYSILAAPEEASQALEIKPEHIEAILSVAVTEYDFILLDVGRVMDALSIKALDRADRIFPVLQAGVPFLRNAHKLLAMCTSLGYPPDKISPIVNRFEKHGEISLDMIRRALSIENIHTVPNSYKEVNASINQGNSLATSDRSGSVRRSLGEFAMSLCPKPAYERTFLDRIFKRA